MLNDPYTELSKIPGHLKILIIRFSYNLVRGNYLPQHVLKRIAMRSGMLVDGDSDRIHGLLIITEKQSP